MDSLPLHAFSVGIAAAALVGCVAGCGGAAAADAAVADAPVADAGPPDAAAGACGAVAGKAFQSVEQHECGLSPNGLVYCYWLVSFDGSHGASGGSFRWFFSDTGDFGSYTCSGNSILADAYDGPSLMGTLNPATGQLTWEQYDYAPCPTANADQMDACPK